MKASEMEKGQAIKVEGRLYTIVDFEHVKLGKGGAVYQTKIKSIANGLIQNIRVRSEEILEEVELQKKSYEYLYSKASEHVLMDMETFDQITLNDAVFGDAVKYLKPNMEVLIDFCLLSSFNENEAREFAQFSKVRNILAHEYLDIRFEQVRKFIQDAEPGYKKLLEFVKHFVKQ